LTITSPGCKTLLFLPQITAQTWSLSLLPEQPLPLLMPEPMLLQVILPVTCLQAQLFCIFLPVTVKYFQCSLGWRRYLCNQLMKNGCQPTGAPANMSNSLKPSLRISCDRGISTVINLKYSQEWEYGVRILGKSRGLSQSVSIPNYSQWQILTEQKKRPRTQWYPPDILSQLPGKCGGPLTPGLHFCVSLWSIMAWIHVIHFWAQVNSWHPQGTQFQPAAFCHTWELWFSPQLIPKITESHSEEKAVRYTPSRLIF